MTTDAQMQLPAGALVVVKRHRVVPMKATSAGTIWQLCIVPDEKEYKLRVAGKGIPSALQTGTVAILRYGRLLQLLCDMECFSYMMMILSIVIVTCVHMYTFHANINSN